MRETMTEYVFTFSSTQHSIAAEQALCGASIPVKVMPLPPQIKAGCGLCLRLSGEVFAQAAEILAQHKIAFSGIFTRREEEGRSAYEPYVTGD